MSKFFITVIGILLLCHFPQERSAAFPLNDSNYQTDNDTTVYDGNTYDVPAELPDAISYFLKNNKYKEWKETDKTFVALQGIVEKDGTITGVNVRKSSDITVLDEEAVRLIKSAKYIPAKYKNKNVRSKFTILVHFPARKQ